MRSSTANSTAACLVVALLCGTGARAAPMAASSRGLAYSGTVPLFPDVQQAEKEAAARAYQRQCKRRYECTSNSSTSAVGQQADLANALFGYKGCLLTRPPPPPKTNRTCLSLLLRPKIFAPTAVVRAKGLTKVRLVRVPTRRDEVISSDPHAADK